MKLSLLSVCIIVLLSNCTPQPPERNIIHDIDGNPKPWTDDYFEQGEKDFTFAIIADLTGGERSKIFEIAVEQLNMLEPDFVLSVGDLIEGGTRDVNQLTKEWDSFGQRARKLTMPFFYLGGNHDLSNPTMQEYWQQNIGPLYYHFVLDDVLFLMLDSEDFAPEKMREVDSVRTIALNILAGKTPGVYEETAYYALPERSTGAMSQAQHDYFSKVIEANQNVKWTFVLMHKPLYTRSDAKGLQPLLNELADRNFTVINGHEHAMQHQVKQGMDFMMLGTTGGYQNPLDQRAFDHITLVRMAETPVITHLRLDGILNKQGLIPLGGDTISFQASRDIQAMPGE